MVTKYQNSVKSEITEFETPEIEKCLYCTLFQSSDEKHNLLHKRIREKACNMEDGGVDTPLIENIGSTR